MILALALILDALAGEPQAIWARIPHPAVLMGRAVAALDKGLNRGRAGRGRGVLAVLVLVLGAGGIGWALSLIPLQIGTLLGAAVLFAQRSLADHVAAVGHGLRLSVAEGRIAVARIVGRDTDGMDSAAVARAAIESGAENLSDGVIAPVFWFVIGGLPGLMIYKMVNTADSMIGHRTPRHLAFGWAAARLDDVLNLIPARLTALLIWLVTPALWRRGVWSAIQRDAARHASPNAGWPEAAMARALGIALSGPRAYHGEVQDFPWVHAPGRRDISAREIRAAVGILWRVWAVVLALALIGAAPGAA